jgi:outer membrane protein assembly factor BamB
VHLGPGQDGSLMKTGVRLTALLVCGVIAVFSADVLFWYRVERRPPAYIRQAAHLQWTRMIDPLYITSTPPIIGRNGTLYVASAGSVHALRASSAEEWVYRTDPNDPISSGSLSQDEEGNLYFATAQSVYSLSPTGWKRWQVDCPRAAIARNARGHAFDANALYTTCDTSLVALGKTDGHEIWHLPNFELQTSSLVPLAPLILRTGNIVFNRDQQIVAIDKRGNTLWTLPPDRFRSAYFLGSGPDDMIYARSFSGGLFALCFNGTIRWKFDAPGSFNESPVRALDGTSYIIAAQGPLYALAPNGRLKWAFLLPPSTTVMGYTAPVLAPDGTIYQLLEDRVIALSSTGKMLSQLQLPGEPRHRGFLALSPNGTLYAVMDNSFIHAIKVGKLQE